MGDMPLLARGSVAPAGKRPRDTIGPTEPASRGLLTPPPDPEESALLLTFVTRGMPLLLAVCSWVVGWALVDVVLERTSVLWALLPTILLILIRIGVEWAAPHIVPGSLPAMAGFLLHTVVLLAAIWFNPFMCIYAFVGYVDAQRFFRQRQLTIVVLVTALLCALGQSGGFPGFVSAPLLFGCLAVVNIVLASAMMHLSLGRERQVAARERAAEALTRAHRKNDALQSQLVEQARTAGIAEERARLSREIHDTVAQGLVGVIRQLEALPDALDDDSRVRVERAETAARECLIEARRAVHALSPFQLRDADLIEAVGGLVAEWGRTNRVVVEFDADAAPAKLDHGPVLLRVVQEGLANVARHAHASSVKVILSGSEANEQVEIQDDGSGFDLDRITRGNGLPGMTERLSSVGGRLDVNTSPGRGCTVTATVPR